MRPNPLYSLIQTQFMAIFEIKIPKDINIRLSIHEEGSVSKSELYEFLSLINEKINKLMSNTDLALQDILQIKGILVKIGGETGTLLQKITDLQNNAPSDTPQSVLDGLADILTQAQTVDNLVPDVAETPVTEPAA